MRFIITLNMPSRKDLIHQIIADHSAPSVEAFWGVVANQGYIVVEELYWDDNKELFVNGPIGLGESVIGKVAEFKRRDDRE